MSWRDFQESTPKDKTDKRDKSLERGEQYAPFVPFIPFIVGGENLKKQETPDPFLAGHHALVHLEPAGDVWLAFNEQAAGTLQTDGIPVLFEQDIRWIIQARGHEARLERLRAIFGRRHRLTKTVLETFPGAKVSSTKPMRVQP